MSEKKFPVIEIFGPVIQGEGPVIGRPTHFVRMGGCDYRCEWCDTLYAVLPDEVKKNATMMTGEEIRRKLDGLVSQSGVRTVTWSGGNPCMHQLGDVVTALCSRGWKQVVETQGTILASWLYLMDMIVVSPKGPSSGMVTDWDKLTTFMCDALKSPKGIFHFQPEICLKVVVFYEMDFKFAQAVHARYPEIEMYIQCGSPPPKPGSSVDQIRTSICERMITIQEWILADPEMVDCRLLPQMHTLMFGHQRGV